MNKNIHIFGGGTVAHITNHLAVCAPAYGKVSEDLYELCVLRFRTIRIFLEKTKMAGGSIETNEDVFNRILELKKNPNTKIIFLTSALIDFEPYDAFAEGDNGIAPLKYKMGKNNYRLDSRSFKSLIVKFKPAAKIVSEVRKDRKDIFLVAFKSTCGATKQEMFEKGLKLCKEGSTNLVLVNDTQTRWNMIITPEEAAYHETQDRDEVLKNLVDMTYYRSQLTFTQSTVVNGEPVKWADSRIPSSIREVVNYCINKNAYKVFNSSTVGHFAIKLSDTEFLTSIRKSNFNDLEKIGMVYVKTSGPDTVLAYGAKPSVGGQSQRIVFNDHKEMDCIVHFHSPLKLDNKDQIPIVSQREVECGSHQCGKNTSSNLKQFGNLKAVMLDKHGPNIVFNKSIDPKEVIDFIEANFDLSQKTGGYNI